MTFCACVLSCIKKQTNYITWLLIWYLKSPFSSLGRILKGKYISGNAFSIDPVY